MHEQRKWPKNERIVVISREGPDPTPQGVMNHARTHPLLLRSCRAKKDLYPLPKLHLTILQLSNKLQLREFQSPGMLLQRDNSHSHCF